MMTVGIIFVLNFVIVLILFDVIRYVSPDNTRLLNETIILTTVVIAFNVLLFRVVGYLTELIEKDFNTKLSIQYYESETSHIKDLRLQSINFRKERHDIRNHLSSIQALAKSGHSEKIDQYIGRMLEEQEAILINKTDSAIESIINNKLNQAKSLGIEVDLELKVPSDGQVDEYEVAVIVGNAIDNAIESCERVGDNKFIHIKTHLNAGYYNIQIENTSLPEVNTQKTLKTSKVDKKNHGFGISNIKYIVEKNHGLLELNQKEGIFQFRCSILMGQ